MQDEPQPIRCRDHCGAAVEDDQAAMQAGWSFLHITNSWRCGACGHALAAAARITGTDSVGGDPLPPDSRGALPRETASSILPPSVKG